MNPLRFLAFLFVVALAQNGAQAHSFLVSSEPPANATIDKAPPEVRLRFSEPLEPAFVSITARVATTRVNPQPPITLDRDGKTVHVKLSDGASGAYSFEWSVVAKDGHRSHGQVDFAVGSH